MNVTNGTKLSKMVTYYYYCLHLLHTITSDTCSGVQLAKQPDSQQDVGGDIVTEPDTTIGFLPS